MRLWEVFVMDIDQFKKWLDVSQKYQSDSFWHQIFDEKTTNQTVKQPGQNPFAKIQDHIPKCDLYETNNMHILEVEIPGLKKEDLHITIRHQLLTIEGEFKTLKQDRKYYFKERLNRGFKKEVNLPNPILASMVSTEIRDGVLFIFLPLNHEEVENIPITFADHNLD